MIWLPVLALVLFTVGDARAHGFTPVVVRIDEHGANVFAVASSEPGAITVRAPGCAVTDEVWRCGPDGLAGAVVSAAPREREVLVRVAFRSGDVVFRALSGGESFEVPRRVDEDAPRATLMRRFFELGLSHVATGFDHLLFLAALVLTVTRWRQLVVAVTAFSVAHALSLFALAAGVVSVPSAPVEACIALSIVVMAYEATSSRAGVVREHPEFAVVPLGLLHGLGFGAALAETGISRARLGESVLAFHVGVELGQLVFAGVVFGVFGLWARGRVRWTRPVAVVVGAMGVALTIDRVWLLGG